MDCSQYFLTQPAPLPGWSAWLWPPVPPNPVMWATGIINPSHELTLPFNLAQIEVPPPPLLGGRNWASSPTKHFPLQECQRHTCHQHYTILPTSTKHIPVYTITGGHSRSTPRGVQRPECRAAPAAHELCGPQQLTYALGASSSSSVKWR